MKNFKFVFALIAFISVIFALVTVRLAHAAGGNHGVSAHRVVHQWRQVERLNDGTFAFMGSDNIWYLYSQQDGTAFVPSCVPDVFVLPKNGHWMKLNDAPTASTVSETENTIIQWTADGAPADLQLQDYICEQQEQ